MTYQNNERVNGAAAAGRSFVSLFEDGRDESPKANQRGYCRIRKQAKTLDDGEIQRLLEYIRRHSLSPFSDELAVSLMFWAGLRAAEVAGTTISDLQDAQGRIGGFVQVGAHNAKGGKRRRIPMHPMIENAANRLVSAHPTIPFVCFSARWGNIKRRSANSLVVHMGSLFRDAGFVGCSSHSGRRTFITNLARDANLYGRSLRDVQAVAGHARLDTTQAYIDTTEDLSPLINSLRTFPDSPEGPYFEPRMRAIGGRR